MAIGITLTNVGIALRQLGEFAHARRNFDEALALHRELEDPTGEAIALINLAELETRDDLR